MQENKSKAAIPESPTDLKRVGSHLRDGMSMLDDGRPCVPIPTFVPMFPCMESRFTFASTKSKPN